MKTALEPVQSLFKEQSNQFYRRYYDLVLLVLMIFTASVLLLVFIVFYELRHRPLPAFVAISTNGQRLELTPFNEPNLLSSTIVKWARKAAVSAYTFDFVNYEKQLVNIRNNFTNAGWQDYLRSIDPLLKTIRQNQLFVNSVVTQPPVISNQGDLPGKGYVWRLQIPFYVTFQSSERSQHKAYTVLLTIVKVPTTQNVAGIGIDQFVMK